MQNQSFSITFPPQLEHSWCMALKEEFQKPYMADLKAFIAKERAGPVTVFPPAQAVFNAFSLTPIDNGGKKYP